MNTYSYTQKTARSVVMIVETFKSMGNGNGNIGDEKNLSNGTNGHYMDCKINFMGYYAGINNIDAVSEVL